MLMISSVISLIVSQSIIIFKCQRVFSLLGIVHVEHSSVVVSFSVPVILNEFEATVEAQYYYFRFVCRKPSR